MPQISGSFSGKSNAQAAVMPKDVPGHELGLVEISGLQTSADPLWNGATVTYWGIADLTAGSGSQTGYFINRHANGDISRGTFGGTIATQAGAVAMRGDWQLTGGTGTFSRATGSGTYQGPVISSTEVEVSWEGNYQLG